MDNFQTPNQVPSQQVPAPQNPIPPKKQNQLLLILLAFIIMVVLLGGLYYFFIYNKNAKKAEIVPTKPEQIENEEATENNKNQIEPTLNIENINKSQSVSERFIILNICYLSQNPEDYYLTVSGRAQYNSSDYSKEARLKYFEKSKLAGNKPEDNSYCLSMAQMNDLTDDDFEYMGQLINTDEDRDGVNLFEEYDNYTSDEKADTDGDGYNDFEEILLATDPFLYKEMYAPENETNQKENDWPDSWGSPRIDFNDLPDMGEPNDLMAEEDNKILEQVKKELYTRENPDMNKILDLCDSIGYHLDKDSCFNLASKEFYDLSYCEEANYWNYVDSWDGCKNTILTNKAKKEQDINYCDQIEFDASSCISSLAEYNLDPDICYDHIDADTAIYFCLPDIYENPLFIDSDLCSSYDDWDEEKIQRCASATSKNINSSMSCLGGESSKQEILDCINNKAASLGPTQCSTIWMFNNWSVEEKINNFESCIKSNQIYNSLEMDLERACWFLPVSKKFPDVNKARIDCHLYVASRLNQIKQCDYYINDASLYGQNRFEARQNCFSEIIKNNDDELCKYITDTKDKKWLSDLKNSSHCLDL